MQRARKAGELNVPIRSAAGVLLSLEWRRRRGGRSPTEEKGEGLGQNSIWSGGKRVGGWGKGRGEERVRWA